MGLMQLAMASVSRCELVNAESHLDATIPLLSHITENPDESEHAFGVILLR